MVKKPSLSSKLLFGVSPGVVAVLCCPHSALGGSLLEVLVTRGGCGTELWGRAQENAAVSSALQRLFGALTTRQELLSKGWGLQQHLHVLI